MFCSLVSANSGTFIDNPGYTGVCIGFAAFLCIGCGYTIHRRICRRVYHEPIESTSSLLQLYNGSNSSNNFQWYETDIDDRFNTP